MNTKTARAIVPQQAAALMLGATLAVMPAAPSVAIMPTASLRPNHAPAEVRTHGGAKRR
jgi:hypothetical protein